MEEFPFTFLDINDLDLTVDGGSNYLLIVWHEVNAHQTAFRFCVNEYRLASVSHVPVTSPAVSTNGGGIVAVIREGSFVNLYNTELSINRFILTNPVCPVRTAAHFAPLMSQILAVASAEQLMSLFPAESCATDQTPRSWPFKVVRHLYFGASQSLMVLS